MAAPPRGSRDRWEHRLLAALAWPANLALAGVAGALLSLGVVTALPAAVAVARSLDRWLSEGDDAVFTNTFRELAGTWRRTLPWGVVAAVAWALLGTNALFLWGRVAAGEGGFAVGLLAASVPVVLALALFCLAVPVAAAGSRDASARAWLVEAGALVAGRPVAAGLLVVLVLAVSLTLVLAPTLAPFFGVSVPTYLALVTFGRGRRTAATPS